jgi:hypothetical protein
MKTTWSDFPSLLVAIKRDVASSSLGNDWFTQVRLCLPSNQRVKALDGDCFLDQVQRLQGNTMPFRRQKIADPFQVS